MDQASEIRILVTSVLPPLLMITMFWGGDRMISTAGARYLYRLITETISHPDRSRIYESFRELFDCYYSIRIGFVALVKNVAIFTLGSILLMLILYILKRPQMLDVMWSSYFITQFVGNGFVVVFLVNFTTIIMHPITINSLAAGSLLRNLAVIILDASAKMSLFLIFTAISWVVFAHFRNSFGGDVYNALRAIPITLKGALLFENLQAVYFYSLMLSSFPMFIMLFIRIMALNTKLANFIRCVFYWLPLEDKPIRIASLFAALSAAIAYIIMFSFISLT